MADDPLPPFPRSQATLAAHALLMQWAQIYCELLEYDRLLADERAFRRGRANGLRTQRSRETKKPRSV